MNEEHARRYAELLIRRGVDLRPNQPLYVYGNLAHREMVALLIEAAYQAGSGPVRTRLHDSLQHIALIRHGRLEDVELCHAELQLWLNEIIRQGAAFVILMGPEVPGLWAEVAARYPERHKLYKQARNRAFHGFRRYAQMGQLCPWVTAPYPTPGWARQVFPELVPGEAVDRLAELIFHFTYADQEDAIALDKARELRLKARCRALDELRITELHVTGGGTDLRIVLAPEARWQGGSWTTQAGQRSALNLPSEEVFTTPDRRRTEGRLAASRPFRCPGGPSVHRLVVRFAGGRVGDFAADSGEEAFADWLDTDEGARHLGEIGLVGGESAVAESGVFFDFLQLDENASSHVALGQGFPWALAVPPPASTRRLEELGCNASEVHLDVPFGSPEVTVVAARSREGEVVLVDRGNWSGRFA